MSKQPLYPHVPKGRKYDRDGGLILFDLGKVQIVKYLYRGQPDYINGGFIPGSEKENVYTYSVYELDTENYVKNIDGVEGLKEVLKGIIKDGEERTRDYRRALVAVEDDWDNILVSLNHT